MRFIWSSFAWEDYLYWQKVDKKKVKRINELVKSCMRKTVDGTGKPAPIKGDLQDYWSRGITSKHRFVCKYENEYIIIAACRFYYKK